MTIIHVAFGGALGAVFRYAAGLMFAFPFATLLVNLLGCFLMGVAFVLLSQGRGLDGWQPFVMTGVLGGFTTFSAFSLDALRLMESGALVAALAYVLGTTIGCILSCALGLWVARGLVL